MTDSLIMGWNWPEVEEKLTMWVTVSLWGTGDKNKCAFLEKPSGNSIKIRLLVKTIKDCLRLGKRISDRPRILVHLTSQSSADSLIVASKCLQRTGSTMTYYIATQISNRLKHSLLMNSDKNVVQQRKPNVVSFLPPVLNFIQWQLTTTFTFLLSVSAVMWRLSK